MRDAERSRYRRRLALPLLLLLLALFAGGASGQRQVPPAPPVPPELRAVEAQLTGLTNDVAKTISDRFSFCVSDTQEDWNGAFNYTSDLGFVQRCQAETRGQSSVHPSCHVSGFISALDPSMIHSCVRACSSCVC